MATLTELNSTVHKDLKISPEAIIEHTSKQHVIALMVTEIAKAATCFPIFITRSNNDKSFAFSAMTSYEMGQSLYVKDGVWEGTYLPSKLRTYPLVLMQSTLDENQFTVGIDEENPALSTLHGSALFDETGKASDNLSAVTDLLKAELENARQAFEFGKTLENLHLLKAVDIKVQYEQGNTNIIQGLLTIDEDALAALDAEHLAQLNKVGYLKPVFALVSSLYQLNVLLMKNNAIDSKSKVVGVQLDDAQNEASAT